MQGDADSSAETVVQISAVQQLLQQQQDSQMQTVHELRLLQQQMGGQRDEVQTEFGAALRALCAQLDRRQEQLQGSISAELARVHDADNNVGRLPEKRTLPPLESNF